MRAAPNAINVRPAIALAALGLALAGCAGGPRPSSSSWYAARQYMGNEPAAAMPAPGIYGFAPTASLFGAQATGSELYRRNTALSAREAQPYRAQTQWPEPHAPREDPIRFYRWRQ